jgi:alanine racemase
MAFQMIPLEQKKIFRCRHLVISQIRTISAGESVGYGRKFMAKKQQKVNDSNWLRGWISRAWGNGVGFISIKDKRQKFWEYLYGYAHGRCN